MSEARVPLLPLAQSLSAHLLLIAGAFYLMSTQAPSWIGEVGMSGIPNPQANSTRMSFSIEPSAPHPSVIAATPKTLRIAPLPSSDIAQKRLPTLRTANEGIPVATAKKIDSESEPFTPPIREPETDDSRPEVQAQNSAPPTEESPLTLSASSATAPPGQNGSGSRVAAEVGNSRFANDQGLYIASVHRLIQTHLRSPGILSRSRSTLLRVGIRENGVVERINLQRSSGDQRLDYLAIDAVMRAQPFAPPSRNGDLRVNLIIPVVFHAQN